jgi:hypothetical protein
VGYFENPDDLAVPFHALAFQVHNVALARSQMPAQLVKRLSFGVHLGGDDPLVVFLTVIATLSGKSLKTPSTPSISIRAISPG